MKITPCVGTVTSCGLQRIDRQAGHEGLPIPPFILSQEQEWWVDLHICQGSASLHELPSSGSSFTPPHSKVLCLPYWQGLPSTYQRDTPIEGNCEVEAYEGLGWGHKTEEKQRHHVAAKELATGQIWHVTLSRWVAQSAATAQSCGFSQPHDLKHQKCLSADGQR